MGRLTVEGATNQGRPFGGGLAASGKPVDALAGFQRHRRAFRTLLSRAKAAAEASSPSMESVAAMGAMLRMG